MFLIIFPTPRDHNPSPQTLVFEYFSFTESDDVGHQCDRDFFSLNA